MRCAAIGRNVYTFWELYIHSIRCVYMSNTLVKNKAVIVRMTEEQSRWLDRIVAAERFPEYSSRSAIIRSLIAAAYRKLERDE